MRPLLAGRFLGTDEKHQHLLQLRLDLEGPNALGMLSADLYAAGAAATGAPLSSVEDPDADPLRWCYLYSLESRAPRAAAGTLHAPLLAPTRPELAGELRLDLATLVAEVTVTSRRRAGEELRARVPLERRSPYLRHARLRLAAAQDPAARRAYELPPFRLGSAAPCPPGLPARELDVAAAFADAGIELTVDRRPALALPAAAYRGGLGDDELHGLLAADGAGEPGSGWWLHLLLAPRSVMPGLLGMMYDTRLPGPRHGAVLFVEELREALGEPAGSPALARELLFTAVHELGHAFNLLHSFHKRTPRPASLSWMNYPHYYPVGRMRAPDQADRFWSAFRFAFDREELAHLRHCPRGDVMMGGDPPGPLPDDAPFGPLGVRLEVAPAVDLGEPFPIALVVENRGRAAAHLDVPYDPLDALDLHVRRPSGGWVRFEPLVTRRALAGRAVTLAPGASHRAVFSPFYGRAGFTFAEPGTYLVAGRLFLGEGPPARLPTLALIVRAPDKALEHLLTDAVFGDEQGHFLTFGGGDHLGRGRDALVGLLAEPRLARGRAAARVRTLLAASLARKAPPSAAQILGPGVVLADLVRSLRMRDVPDSILLAVEAAA